MGKSGRPRHPDVLTPREWEVLALLRAGLSNDEIAQRLGISFDGAKYHVSEIITKLGVRDRHEAAQWQPGGDGAQRNWLFASIAALRRLHVSSLATPVGAGIIAVAVIAVGALAWGVMATRRDDSPRWSYTEASSGSPSVMVFDLAKREARRVAVPDKVAYAQWLKPGETWLALQLDSKRIATPPETDVTYRVYDSGGGGVWTVPAEITRKVVPAPDGTSVLVERTDNQYIIKQVASGLGGTFLSSARDLSFSPDGKRVAYVTIGGSDKDNQVHDWRSVIEGEKNDLTGYGGGGLAIQSQREADGLMELPPEPWSPDGNYLLVERFGPCGVVTPDPGNCYGMPTFEVYGAQVTGKIFWNAYAGRLRSAQWAGPGRLFLTFFPEAEYDPDFPDAQSLIVDLGLQKQPAPTVFQGSCCVSFSPDGHYAIVPHGTGNAASQRCSLVDASTGAEIAGFDETQADVNTMFCASVSWTPDGSAAIASQSSGH